MYRAARRPLTPRRKWSQSSAAITASVASTRTVLWSGCSRTPVSRQVSVAYLLLTLGYPGVKFVTDVLIRN